MLRHPDVIKIEVTASRSARVVERWAGEQGRLRSPTIQTSLRPPPRTGDPRRRHWQLILALRADVTGCQGVQTAASKPPPNKSTLPPIVIGMTPAIGPPLVAEAGVSSV
jgi:hypothetical protein